jgi:hypothetical protein
VASARLPARVTDKLDGCGGRRTPRVMGTTGWGGRADEWIGWGWWVHKVEHGMIWTVDFRSYDKKIRVRETSISHWSR